MKSIIVIGPICSGKSMIAQTIAAEYNFPVASFGGYLKQYALENGLGTERKDLQDLGEKFILERPKAFLEDVMSFSLTHGSVLIFEGVRHRIIFNMIRELSEDSLSVFIDIPYNVRWQRFLSRDKSSDTIKTEQEFEKMNAHPVEKEILSLKPNCLVINNYPDQTLTIRLSELLSHRLEL